MRTLSTRKPAAIAAVAGALMLPAAGAALPVADYTQPAARDTEPVILTGKDFADWSARSNVTAKAPGADVPSQADCYGDFDQFGECVHNNYAEADADTGAAAGEGTPVDRLLAYSWNGSSFVQIPFQVDEMFTRYLDNSASGFSFYSGQDQHTTYAFDREGFRFTKDGPPDNPCLAQPDGAPTTPDPVAGLDDNDELVFMASDAGELAPDTATLPAGVDELRRVEIRDPTDTETVRAVYVAKAAAPEAGGATPAFNADNGYVEYERDANADLFERSQSSYSDYGNAARGVVCDANGNVTATDERRRPRDYATVTTDRYRFRYDGRWLMTKLEISPDGGDTYGPDVIDRWKARAFQQDPSSETPCCGYEEEDTNWGGSSTLLGERWGPVRAIRETWGADSGTNVIRRETFYRDEIRQKNYLRVHVIPPLDGIYAQWDYNAGQMTRYYNSAMTQTKPEGVAIDGRNDEVFGNLDDPCNPNYAVNDTSELDKQYRTLYSTVPGLCSQLIPDAVCAPFDEGLEELNNFLEEVPQDPDVPRPCGQFPYHQSIDLSDPTMSEGNAGFQWNVTAGPNGTIVDRYQIDDVTDQSAGGLAQNVFAVPYYRDDSCFDDGTGTNPGRDIGPRKDEEPRTYTAPDGSTQPRECWRGQEEDLETERYYQGSIGTHGLHILMIAESDNARMTVPVTELVAEQRMVMLPGEGDITVGEQYGRGFEKPLVAIAVPEQRSAAANEPPSASFEYTPAEPQTSRPVNFDSTSEDADDGIASLDWDLDGDGQFDDAQGDQVTHTFTTVGEHSVGLRATDTSGDTATAQRTVTVTNPPPTGSISYSPSSPRPRQTVTLTGTGSDENGSVTGFAWDLDSDGAFDDGSSSQATRSFPTPGDYPVALRLTDNDGASTVVEAVVRVGRGKGR